MKPTVYVANAWSAPTYGSDFGKNTWGNTSAAAVPYRKKSYHSIVVPIVLATSARSNWLRSRSLPAELALSAIRTPPCEPDSRRHSERRRWVDALLRGGISAPLRAVLRGGAAPGPGRSLRAPRGITGRGSA